MCEQSTFIQMNAVNNQSGNVLLSFQSVSDDSADLASGDKESSTQSGSKSGQRAAVPWWEDEEFNSQGGEKGSI